MGKVLDAARVDGVDVRIYDRGDEPFYLVECRINGILVHTEHLDAAFWYDVDVGNTQLRFQLLVKMAAHAKLAYVGRVGTCDTLDDTDRLNFLMQFLSIEDVGDDTAVCGVVVNHEGLEEKLGFGPPVDGKAPGLARWDMDLRELIDRAILAHKETV